MLDRRETRVIFTTRALRVGTRASRLARWQTQHVSEMLIAMADLSSPVEVIIASDGDRDTTTPLPALGGQGVFTDALERELLSGAIDFAVHSLKDLPVSTTPGLTVAAVGFRQDARDVLVSAAGWHLATLPIGARVGTCSVRRAAQLLALRSDLTVVPLRGNVDRRLARAAGGEFDAIVLAAAGLVRLGVTGVIREWLPFDRFLPAPGQGALAVQCRTDDGPTLELLATLDTPTTRAATDAERSFLEGLGGGCLAPIAAYASVSDQTITLAGLVAANDGSRVVRVYGSGDVRDGRGVGLRLADEACRRGALELLA